MLKLFLVLIYSLMTFSIFAGELSKKYSVKTYEDAEKAKTNIKFYMESTKFGFITTSFEGYIKKFKLIGKDEDGEIKNLQVVFKITDMDTDSEGRNEKMWETCLDYKKYKKITVTFKKSIPLTASTEITIPAVANIRGKDKPIDVKLKVEKTDSKFTISGASKVQLTKLEIPDPSIVIASVRDLVEISFQFKDIP